MNKKLYYIAISIAICLVLGFLSGFATKASIIDWYPTLNKPSFNPPNGIFAPVWLVLYTMMGISAGIVWAKGFHHVWVKTALYHFIFQLLFNALWSTIFFGLKMPFMALLVIITLLILIILTIKWFKVVDKTAAYLLIPYLLWVCFATVLNFSIWQLN
ncbi:tryptophan-rich sensory protein [Cellulophaga baltica]|uniref:TspO/MBR family protein n=1 Tax=Cellulophaga TaxID=104264 RepID=UPI001C07622C|nr:MULTISPECIES: TspO/MBR family protein [Cellulophaga]MBU2995512.1 tryptophan-rich sensory protein [Cellulophaga baltica]MDO6766906.1 TspO/MBR family protein [Cellulophaga sp. 1_MG-2023]